MKLTVFTPSFNRENTLPKLYHSLKRQSCHDFEWLVIDDGSTDDTENLILRWQNFDDAPFLIRYYKVNHGGKHRALNKAYDLAKGEYFFIVDSDDFLVDNAIDIALKMIKSIDKNTNFYGVSGLKINSRDYIKYKEYYKKIKRYKYIDASDLERGYLGINGDHAEIYKTEQLKAHKFPEFKGEYFVTESVCWYSIAAMGLKIRWFNVPLYVYDYRADGLTKSGANKIKGHLENYNGYLAYVNCCKKLLNKYDFYPIFSEYKQVAEIRNESIIEQSHDLNLSSKEYCKLLKDNRNTLPNRFFRSLYYRVGFFKKIIHLHNIYL